MSNQRCPTKAGEAARVSGAPFHNDAPGYGNHVADKLVTVTDQSHGTSLPAIVVHPSSLPADGPHTEFFNPSYGSGLPTMDDDIFNESPSPQTDKKRGDSLLAQPVQTSPRSMAPLPLVAQDGPLSLTLNGHLIFSNTIPANALYYLNFTLNTMRNSVTLWRSVPSPTRADGTPGKIGEKELYQIWRPILGLDAFTLHGLRTGTFPGVVTLQLKTVFARKLWECKFKDKVVLSAKAGEWFDGDGRLVASEVNEVTREKVKARGKVIIVDKTVCDNPGLNFERKEHAHGLLVDLLVACWCAKTWHAETYDAKLGG